MNPWLAFLITLSLIILVHEWGHFVMARLLKVRVERFSFGFGPRLLRWSRGETEYALSLLPFGGYVKLAGESEDSPGRPQPWEYRSRPVGQRATIVLAGPLINYLLGFLLFTVVFAVGAPVYTARIGQVLEGFPAQAAGLKPGDRIVAVGGQPVRNWEEMTRLIQARTEAVPLTIGREGKEFPLTLEPRVNVRTNLFGRQSRTGMVGITPSDEVEIQRYPLVEAAAKAIERVVFLTRVTLAALWQVATGGLSVRDSITGPIGIFYITTSVAAQGITPLLQLIAILSTSIGLFNLLPIPVLDGGHLAFLTIERVRGRPVPLSAQEAMTRVGLGLLLLLLAVVTYNDLLRFNLLGLVR